MSHAPPLTPHPSPLTDPGEEGEAVEGYRPICGLAIAGAVLGVLSLTAFVNSLFWALASIAAVVNGVALWQIVASGNVLKGRGAALAGLTCSLLFGSMAVTNTLLEPARIRGDARRFAFEWLAELQHGEIERAHQRTLPFPRRLGAERPTEFLYSESAVLKRDVEQYASQEPVRTLAALGERAQVRYIRNDRSEIGVDDRWAEDVFEVTADRDGRPTSCALKVTLRAWQNRLTKEWGWEVKSAEWLGTPPDDWN
ncbi:MAG TPA: DUF4190 domain-containing protein [Pirellulales bacterium]|nr:DUF4190 domain-containing protein [Pirellulales bacterium]